MRFSQNKARSGMINRKLVVFGCIIVVLGLTAWYFLNRAADIPSKIPAPERQGLNAPFITTPNIVVDKMVEMAELKESDLVYDLGCGDGRIVITAALKSGCSGVGFDIDPERVAEATENAKLHGVDERVKIKEQDVFTVDLSKADVAMMYLLPWMMTKLLPQFLEMKDGCRIVAHDFWIDGVEPDRVLDLVNAETQETKTLYLYRTPLKVDPTMEKGKPPRPSDDRVESQTVVFPKESPSSDEG